MGSGSEVHRLIWYGNLFLSKLREVLVNGKAILCLGVLRPTATQRPLAWRPSSRRDLEGTPAARGAPLAASSLGWPWASWSCSEEGIRVLVTPETCVIHPPPPSARPLPLQRSLGRLGDDWPSAGHLETEIWSRHFQPSSSVLTLRTSHHPASQCSPPLPGEQDLVSVVVCRGPQVSHLP